jgi:hypothetical protein
MSTVALRSAGYVVGLDLAQMVDHTALAVVERVEEVVTEDLEALGSLAGRRGESTERVVGVQYHVPLLDRFPRGTSYPDIVTHVRSLVMRSSLHTGPAAVEWVSVGPGGGRMPSSWTSRDRSPTIVVDATGVGRAVLDMLRRAGLKPKAVTIHGGNVVTSANGEWRVPKRDLVAAVQVALQTGKLKIARRLPLAPLLIEELLNFRVTITETAHDAYEARQGKHDDLVLALAIALWHDMYLHSAQRHASVNAPASAWSTARR